MAKIHKPYRIRNLINLLTVAVMLSSGFLTAMCFAILRAARVLPTAFFATVWMPLIVIIVANILSSVFQMVFVPKIIRPVESLIKATEKVAKGDFSVRIPTEKVSGEMLELVESFNAMTLELGSIEIFRNDFIRNFSHEFKTPIVSMKGFAKQLKNSDLSEEERNQYCDIIISESERLTNMASNILLLSKYENQEIVTDKKPYRLDEQLRDSILLLEKEWTEKALELELELPPITVEQNADMLGHVWTNLVANAVKFTPHGGKIEITAKENNESVAVTVRDSGIGMSRQQMEHIFDKYYQADTSRGEKGNGLGLCIAKRVCTLCGGTISVRSVVGQGSVFTVILPKQQKKNSV